VRRLEDDGGSSCKQGKPQNEQLVMTIEPTASDDRNERQIKGCYESPAASNLVSDYITPTDLVAGRLWLT
jgi:hypothetical protein